MDSILQHWKKSKMEPKIRRDRPAKICFAPMQTVGHEMVQDTFLVPLLDWKVRQNKILGKQIFWELKYFPSRVSPFIVFVFIDYKSH